MNIRCLQVLVIGLSLLPVRGSGAIHVQFNYSGVTVPNELADRRGNAPSFLPFLDINQNPIEIRYQQVFAASAFTNLAPGGGYLTGIGFRPDCANQGNYSSSNISIWLSTTSKKPDGLAPSFDVNVGPDVTLVKNGPPFGFTKVGGCGTESGFFESLFGSSMPLLVPFIYDPARGNLLMEIKVHSSGSPLKLFHVDAEDVLGDAVSRIAGRGFNASFADITSDSAGMPVRFTFSGPPILSAELTATGTFLLWNDEPYGFILQWSDQLGKSANWTKYPGVINSVGAGGRIKSVMIPKNDLGLKKYLRLQHPTLPPLRRS